MTRIRTATQDDEAACNALAKLSPYTRDFSNPPMSLKSMRKVAFPQGEVFVAYRQGDLVGFVWSRPMKPNHMPFSTVYYMAVAEAHRGQGVARNLLVHALKSAKEGRIELVCEDANPAAAFYAAVGARRVLTGTVGKDNRPYTRWRLGR